MPPASSTRRRTGASTRVSAIPASSTTRTQPPGSPPERRALPRRRRSVTASISVALASSSAARPLGAAPSTEMPERSSASPRARRAVVLPAPATPTTQTTRSGESAAVATSDGCSAESLTGASARADTTCTAAARGTSASRPARPIPSASRSRPRRLLVVKRPGRPGVASFSTSVTSGPRMMCSTSARTAPTRRAQRAPAPARAEPEPLRARPGARGRRRLRPADAVDRGPLFPSNPPRGPGPHGPPRSRPRASSPCPVG